MIRYSDIETTDAILFPYQKEMKHLVFSKWDTMNNVMVQMPTGTGKTILFASIVRDIRNWILDKYAPGIRERKPRDVEQPLVEKLMNL